jgi:hypothetical protein
MTKLRWLLAPVAVGLIALVMSCSGDKDSDSPGSGARGSGSNVSNELDLTNAASSLLELRSFRFDVSVKLDFDMSALGAGDSDDEFGGLATAFLALLSDIKLEGAYQAPDSFEVQMRLAGEDIHAIQIGDRAWIDDGSGWEETDADSSDLSFLGDPTELAFDLLPQEVLRNAKTKSETVNGVKATRYSFDKKALEAIAEDLGEGTAGLEEVDEATLDVWLTDQNIPVKVVMNFKGKAEDGTDMAIAVELNVTDLNSDKVKIEAPI